MFRVYPNIRNYLRIRTYRKEFLGFSLNPKPLNPNSVLCLSLKGVYLKGSTFKGASKDGPGALAYGGVGIHGALQLFGNRDHCN